MNNRVTQADQLMDFLDFLSNPAEYQKTLKELRGVVNDYKDVVEKQRKIKDIDKWRHSQQLQINKEREALIQREESLSVAENKLKEVAGLRETSFELDKQHLLSLEQELKAREMAVSNLEKERDKLLRLQNEALVEREKLQRERDQLKDRQAKLKKTLQDLS
jgi:DNA repair exonuclease SbcCD ATPase subunit